MKRKFTYKGGANV